MFRNVVLTNYETSDKTFAHMWLQGAIFWTLKEAI